MCIREKWEMGGGGKRLSIARAPDKYQMRSTVNAFFDWKQVCGKGRGLSLNANMREEAWLLW